ncbi:MAG: HAD hydrolase-like protein [Clostridia bacterium]|nr:HAD hydrolase-like protein [Clostridia bacterium]
MQNYKWLLFDLDGTLIYSHEGIFSCVRYVLKVMGETVSPTDTDLRKTIGPPLEYTFSRFFGMDEERAKQATKIYREEYRRTGVHMNSLVEGVKDALAALKNAGYILAIATSKATPFAMQIAQKHGIDGYFTEIVGCGLDGSFPTKASVIGEALRRLGAEKNAALMVGDRKQDVEGANDNGIDCAVVKIGYAEEGEFERVKPKYICDNFETLTELLQK